MRHITRFGLVALIVLCSTTAGHAIPQLINYQGVLTDGGGTPITVATTVEFRIWDMSAAGTELWMESQSVTPGSDGRFTVLLGSVNPIPDLALAAAAAYLGLTISPDPEMAPRTQLVAVAYAYRPGTVDGASGGNITSKVSIGSGHINTGSFAFVAGMANAASGDGSTVSGGQGNTANNSWTTVGGGMNDTASGYQATVGGGGSNTASGTSATVGGGGSNIASGDGSTVAGGTVNLSSGLSSTTSGGTANISDGDNSTIAGGVSNRASGKISTVSGGWKNTASDTSATVGGGMFNEAGGIFSVVAGGGGHSPSDSNAALGAYSAVSGGRQNRAVGPYSVVPGGRENEAGAQYTFAAGRRAKAISSGAYVWADGTDSDFLSTASNQFRVRASGGTQIYTNAALTAGVTLAAGASAWAMVSDRAAKRNIRPVDGEDILSKLAQLPISRWSYKAQNPGIEHVGPMAQDFYRLFGLGDDDKTISTLDPDGVALAAIQELHKRTQRIDKLEAELGELRSLVQELMVERQ